MKNLDYKNGKEVTLSAKQIGQNLKKLRYSRMETQESLAEKLRYSKELVSAVEQGKARSTDDFDERFIMLLGEEKREYYYEQVYFTGDKGIGRYIEQWSLPLAEKFISRYDELKELAEAVESNQVTVVCADGGVGKTSLVNEYLSSGMSNKLRYIQTISFFGEDFSEENFLKKIRLTMDGTAAVERNSENNTVVRNYDLLGKYINEFGNGALFVIDNLDLISLKGIKSLTHFPKCKFIITTRRVEGFDRAAESLLRLSPFDESDALSVFECHLERKLTDEEKAIFDTDINSWCLGNAEALYFVAKMLSGNELSDYVEFKKEAERDYKFEATVSNDTDGDRNETLAKKLATLFRFNSFMDERITRNDFETRKEIKALGVLHLTKMLKVPVSNLKKYIKDRPFSHTDTVTDLERKGFIKTDGKFVWMHPLIAHALEINGMSEAIDDSARLFAYLITDRSIIGTTIGDMNQIDVPDGIEELKPLCFFPKSSAKKITIPESVSLISKYAFWCCWSLSEICVDKNNNYFFSTDDCLYSKDGKVLLLCMSKKEEFIIPDGVEEIKDHAFDGFSSAKRVFISKNVSRIGYRAFADSEIKFKVDEKNMNYKSVEGKLFTISGEELSAPKGCFARSTYSNDSQIENLVHIDIIDTLLDEENTENIFMYNDEGRMLEFAQIAVIPYDETLYCILKPVSKIRGIGVKEAVVFKVAEEPDHPPYLCVEADEEVANKIFCEYYKLVKMELDKSDD